MQTTIQAIFENGVLRPLSPTGLREHEVVEIAVRATADQGCEREATGALTVHPDSFWARHSLGSVVRVDADFDADWELAEE